MDFKFEFNASLYNTMQFKQEFPRQREGGGQRERRRKRESARKGSEGLMAFIPSRPWAVFRPKFQSALRGRGNKFVDFFFIGLTQDILSKR